MEHEILLDVRHLTHIFPLSRKTAVKAVDDVSFQIRRGEIFGLVGESGSGKSMSALAIAGLLSRKDMKKRGEILFEGVNLLDCDRKTLRKFQGNEIGMIFQEPMTSLNPVFTVKKQIAEPFIIHRGMKKKQAEQEVIKMLEAVQIPNPEAVANQYPHQLSGGMRQRVMIAMALACRPKILIADEPTTALDVTIQAQILRLMNDLQRENGTSIIFITHDLGVINEMADDVVVMYCGQVVEQSSARVIFTNCKYSPQPAGQKPPAYAYQRAGRALRACQGQHHSDRTDPHLG